MSRSGVPGRSTSALLAAAVLVLTACAAPVADDGGDVAPPGAAAPVPSGAVDARLASLDDLTAEVESALADASARSGVPVAAIAVVSAALVTWSDGSLGCSQPDRVYTQALVPGFLLVLEVAGERVAYHGAAGEDPFPCGWPTD